MTNRQTDTQNDYCNPRCACAPRVNNGYPRHAVVLPCQLREDVAMHILGVQQYGVSDMQRVLRVAFRRHSPADAFSVSLWRAKKMRRGPRSEIFILRIYCSWSIELLRCPNSRGISRAIFVVVHFLLSSLRRHNNSN